MSVAVGINGVNATTLELLSAYREGQTIPQAENFGEALAEGGVDAGLARNVTNCMILYAAGAENYAIALNGDGDSESALASWNAETYALILAFSAIPKIQLDQMTPLVNEYMKNQLLGIQANAVQNFSAAVRARAIGQGNLLPFYIAERL